MAVRAETVLYLARHGQATSGPNHRWEASDPLTDVGHAQAADLARHVATLDPAPSRVVVSPAVRSRETAAPCAAALGLNEVVDDRLLEFGSSAVSPYTLAEMMEHLPFDDIWHPDDPGYDGETIGAFWQRTAAAAEDLLATGGSPLVVSHAGTTLGLLRWALGIAHSAPDSFAIHVPNASLTTLEARTDRHGRRRIFVRAIGESSFLAKRTSM